MIPQAQTLDQASRASMPVRQANAKRWPMAFSILGAIAASLALWAVIFWIVSLVLGMFG